MFDQQEIKRAGSEEVLRQIPAGVVIAEAPSGKILLVNRQAQRMLEQQPGRSVPSELGELPEVHDSSGVGVFHSDGRPFAFEEWPLVRSIRSGEEVRDEEIDCLLADGTRLWLRCDSSPIYDDEGNLVAGVLLAHDVTERKRAEEQLAYHARLLENMHEAVIVMDDRFVVQAWNRGAEEIYGWRADEVLGRDVREVVPPDLGEEQWAEALRELDQTGRWRAELIMYHKNGTPIHTEVIVAALRGEQGRITGYLSINRDMAERKRAEESRARYAAILEATTDFVSTADPGGRVLSVNRPGRRMLGIGEEEDVTNTTIADYHPGWASRIVSEQGIPAAVRDGAWRGESAFVSREGREIPISQSIVSHKGPDGEEEYLSTVARDITERKRSEEERQRLADIVQTSSDFIGIAGLDWRPTFLNEAGQRLVGLHGIEEVRRTHVLDYFMPEDRAFVRDELVTIIEEEGRWAGELELRHFETGEAIPVLWDGFRVDDPETGEPIGLATVTRDITERKKAEEQLSYHAHLLENLHDAVIATDERFIVTAWNKGAEEMYGWTAGEALGRNIREVVPSEPSDEQWAEVQRELDETGRFRTEWITYRRDGTPLWVEVTAVALQGEQGDITGYLSIDRDITERKRAEQEIEARTRQQAVVAELGLRALENDDLQYLMDDAVTLISRTLGVEYYDIQELLPDGEELLLRAGVGWREGVVGNTMADPNCRSQVGYALLSGEPVIVEDLSMETRFGIPSLLHEHGIASGMTVVIHGRDEPFGVLCVNTTSRRTFTSDDVNFLQAVANVLSTAIERKKAEEKLSEVREAERSRIARDLHDEALRDLTYALAEAQHVQAVSTEAQPVRRLGRLVAALKQVGQQLRGAIYDLSLGAEQNKPFHDLLETLVELHRTMAPECEIRLEVEDGIFSDPLGKTGSELLRILGEALTNARRHSGAASVRVGVWSSENKLCAEVSDDGRGFDPAREPPTTTGGVGLRGMRERACSLGGVLKLQSKPGEGTKVRFELTLKKDRQEESEEEVRILLVEDHVTVREAIASAFEREVGFVVVGQAASLAEARRVLEEVEPVDVAVVDLGLPDGYGGDLIGVLREANPQAQALVLSASLDRAEIGRAVEAGAAGALHKTAHLNEVVQTVRRLRAGETPLPLEEVVELLRLAGSKREQEYEAHRVIEKLTPREIEVLRALAEGLDSQGIADRLHISVRTQRNHMSSILSKLGVHSQLQALVFALRHGLVEIP